MQRCSRRLNGTFAVFDDLGHPIAATCIHGSRRNEVRSFTRLLSSRQIQRQISVEHRTQDLTPANCLLVKFFDRRGRDLLDRDIALGVDVAVSRYDSAGSKDDLFKWEIRVKGKVPLGYMGLKDTACSR